MYYLQSRYYDPETGRFLNADDVNFLGATETLLSYNAFAYCENDPVNSFDPSGLMVAVAPLKKIIVYMDSIVLLLIACGVLSAGAGNSWSPAGWILMAGGVVVIVGSVAYLCYYDAANRQIQVAKRTKIPSKLKSKKNKDRIKTPDTDPGEFTRNKQGDYIHKKTGWKFHKDKSGHFGGPHWDVGPNNGKTGDYYNVSKEGIILK